MIDQHALTNAVHLWTASLSLIEAASTSILDVHERQRSERFSNAAKRDEYVRSRWLLRLLLSEYTGEPAARIRLAYLDKGKPYLSEHDLYFSLSHSHGRWIAAFTGSGRIGADLEPLMPRSGLDSMIRTYFHKEIRELTEQMEPERKLYHFYKHWTQMEAFVKLHGMGQYATMNTIRSEGQSLMFEGEPDSRAACASYPIHAGYLASIAFEGETMPPVVIKEWALDGKHRGTEEGVENACTTKRGHFPAKRSHFL